MNSPSLEGVEDCTSKESGTKKSTRSAARHRRRKRMKEARKHKDPEFLEGNGSIGRNNVDDIPLEKTVVTKSTARRLRKKKKTNEEDNSEEQQHLQSSSNNIICLPASWDLGIVSLDKPYQDKTDEQKSEEKEGSPKEEKHPALDDLTHDTNVCLNTITNSYTEKPKFDTLVAQSKSIPRERSDLPEAEREKIMEDIKAERKARKAEKAAAKANAKAAKTGQSSSKAKITKENETTTDTVKETDSTTQIEVAATPVINDIQETPDAARITLPPNEKSNISGGGSKALLRAERRAKQEAQRAAKQKKQQEATQTNQPKPVKNREPASNKSSTDDRTSSRPKETPSTVNAAITSIPSPPEQLSTLKKKVTPTKLITVANNKDAHEVTLFKHLYHERELAFIVAPSVKNKIHPGIIRLGVQYANRIIVGSNARCVALLAAVKQLVRDFERPSQADFVRSLESTLQESMAYLHHCRPTAVSMQNALRHLKWQMTQLQTTISDADAKTKLESAIDTYIREQIQLAGEAISITIQKKISDGDVILTYGYSSLINKILLDAHAAGKMFRVIVVDSRPWLEGKEQLRRLAKNGIECSYILINALSYIMAQVCKVFLGAHAILANGAVMSRVGTSQVALIAKAFNIPVLVACEMHKSCERVQTDSIVYNELGNPDDLAGLTAQGSPTKKAVLANWKSKPSLNLLNLTYDVTPASLVTAVVTELAILPCTSVPVILRIKPSQI